jgi:dienelactone hydrolase
MPKPRRLASVSALFLLAAVPCARGEVASATLPGTEPLTIKEPLDEVMVAGISRYALHALEDSQRVRDAAWGRDKADPEADRKTLEGHRSRLRTIVGAVDERAAADGFEVMAKVGGDGVVARFGDVVVYAVRWPVLPGVTGEGLLLEPRKPSVARVIAIPDADWTPEMFAGLAAGLGDHQLAPARLAAAGVEVVVPTLISRDDTYSGSPLVAYTNQPHREFIYRQAFPLGRHIIGYEVDKIQAAVDQLRQLNERQKVQLPIGVMGVGEGGLLALYAAAIDPRIDAALVSGYFQKRTAVWEEPIYRNVWSQLTELGDAEIAGLIAPRPLVIEACAAPEVAGPPPPRDGRRGGAAPGRIKTCALDDVLAEYERAKALYARLDAKDRISIVASAKGAGPSGSEPALTAFLAALEIKRDQPPALGQPELAKDQIDPAERQRRQVQELTDYTQRLMRLSPKVRDEFWAKADRSSVPNWVQSTEFYRNYVWEEMIGKLPPPTIPPNVRSRQILDEPAYTGYEVAIDVYPDVIAAGILLLPKNMRPTEKRPVVVCQHGLEGVSLDTISRSGDGYPYYKAFASDLAQRGFIVYAPQNPYRGEDRFRVIQRQSNPLKRSLFSYIIPQHERTLEWLATLPNVDPGRIGFYGLSYGGKTAMRVPPILKDRYALSICSADFNDWIRKMVSVDDSYGYVFTGEYEMPEWNMAHVASYAELASLMTPRPFMVERGHDDGVAPDEWVAAEFAKARRHYDQLGLGDRVAIEFFNGPHTIHGVETYQFLHKHLDWPSGPGK